VTPWPSRHAPISWTIPFALVPFWCVQSHWSIWVVTRRKSPVIIWAVTIHWIVTLKATIASQTALTKNRANGATYFALSSDSF